MFEWLASPEAWMALGTLIALEIVLFAMAFAVFIELLNIRYRKVSAPPVALHDAIREPKA